MHELKSLLETACDLHGRGRAVALATVVEVSGSVYRRPGAHLLIGDGCPLAGMISGGCLEADVAERAGELVGGRKPELVTYDTTSRDDVLWSLGVGCNGVVTVLLEELPADSELLDFYRNCLETREQGLVATVYRSSARNLRVGTRYYCGSDAPVNFPLTWLSHAHEVLNSGKAQTRQFGDISVLFEPVALPLPLLLCGAGVDAIPVASFAKQLGWDVSVVDRRPGYLRKELYPQVDRLLQVDPERLVSSLVPSGSVAVVMAHHATDDLAYLRSLLRSPVRYIGMLGPRSRTRQFVQQLRREGEAVDESRIFGPIGLDLGAETPAEIALSILAEIKAVLNNRGAGSLRDRRAPIHEESEIRLAV